MKENYQKISLELIAGLKDTQREVVLRRFGLAGRERETLEAIGKDFGVCRERVRQIEESALEKIRPRLNQYQTVYQDFLKYFQKVGQLKKEDILLSELGEGKFQNEVRFLLSLKKPFEKMTGNDDFYSFWYVNKNSFQTAKKAIDAISNGFEKNKKPLPIKDITLSFPLKKEFLMSYLEASKKIQRNDEGFYGLRNWPEINPKGIKDKAYLAFKKAHKPLHFSEVASLILGSHLQTVHNELIRDPRFILVGRGVYALAEWGYEPGQVKDIILKILQKTKKPLTKEEILKKVLEQRVVKENTVLLNLNNKKYFLKDPRGRYLTKEI